MLRIPLITAGLMMVLQAGPTAAQQASGGTSQSTWGQEVKTCNQTSCYPGGTNRGTYVRNQAQDAEGPGYGREIHSLANPGQSNPQGTPER